MENVKIEESGKLPESEFKRLIDCLQEAIIKNKELTNNIGFCLNKIKPIPPKDDCKERLKEDPSISITNTLWSEIDRIRSINSDLNIISNHLQELVG